jgi:hypothetical protein
MEVIHVPRPSKTAMNPDRPANALLLAQVSHFQHAERQLPLRYRSDIYIHAIRTEGEAASYIREVTEAIHQAHADAAKGRERPTRKRGMEISAAERPKRSSKKKTKTKTKKKAKTIKRRRK